MNRIVDGQRVTATGPMAPLPEGERGVFETLLLRDGAPVFWAEHWTRFVAGCRWAGFAPPADAIVAERLSRELAAENAHLFGVLRIAAWRAADRVTWRIETSPPRPHMIKPELRVGWGGALPVIDAARAFKHLGRRVWQDALRTARERGQDEALLSDAAGHVVEACVSNLFFVRDGVLHTPALDVGPLPGIMRAQILALSRARGWRVLEGVFTATEVVSANEIWLSNSLLGLRPVAWLDGREMSFDRPVLERFRNEWRAVHGWDPVVIFPAES